MPVSRTGPLASSAQLYDLSVAVDKDGTVRGTAAPGARVEVANLSTAPTSHELPHDLADSVIAGADGTFALKLKETLGGDVLQVHVSGSTSSAGHISTTVQVRVDADDRTNDPRAAFLSVKRLRVDAMAPGALTIGARTNLPLSEPDAVVRFTNTRTGATADVVVDPLGRIPLTQLAGFAGDPIEVAITDDIATRMPVVVGTIAARERSVRQPNAAGNASYLQYVDVVGPLFLAQIGLGKQGSLGDCPVPAGASAICAADENALSDIIRPVIGPDGKEGWFGVTFHPVGKEPVEITVDGKLYTRGGSSPVYGSGESAGADGIEKWFPLVEKAYADLVGGYDVLEKGTSVGQVMSDLLGRDNHAIFFNESPNVDDVWQRMLRAREHKQAMACGTYPSSDSARYRGTGLHANHAYSVLDAREVNGERIVTMRNPWGGSAGYSGIFEMKLADLCALYQVLNIC